MYGYLRGLCAVLAGVVLVATLSTTPLRHSGATVMKIGDLSEMVVAAVMKSVGESAVGSCSAKSKLAFVSTVT